MSVPIVGLPRPRPKRSVVLALIVCPTLLVLSVIGLWRILQLPDLSNLISERDIFFMLTLLVLPIFGIVIMAILAAQRLEYERLSSTYQVRVDQMQKRLNAQEDFLRAIVDYSPENLTIYDKSNNYWFVNATSAKALSMDPAEVVGKQITKVIPQDRARKLLQRLDAVRAQEGPIEALDQITDEKGAIRFIQGHFQKIEAFGDFSGGIIVREEDITPFIVERERRESMLRQLINTLVAVVDRRDPYASGHSQRVGQLARVLAEELVLPEHEIETAETSGWLMNFGKLLVSRQILTKTTALTQDELQRVRDAIMTSADILSLIDFVGPVVPTLRQVLEKVDGTGSPKGLKGDQILMTARIVAVSNAFVALASPRAHRPSLDFREAIQRMNMDIDRAFDRKVVMALQNCLENRAEKLAWLRSGAVPL